MAYRLLLSRLVSTWTRHRRALPTICSCVRHCGFGCSCRTKTERCTLHGTSRWSTPSSKASWQQSCCSCGHA
ncbi:hypothetical protein J3E72DRAFT_365296 [Bipolaris maydis]|uniref:uncharacterized protein n=1 Tax=Cochliobolus heterostrophus TaxID=5016 RepID=UPI0024D4BF19|nr:hypothetical protein J3E74DRAFT_390243 [Bipolaris maydis]KAJ5052653.1 hypothetical protein J3E74DRAFT_388522 [Bipolaris maydis]KAJ6192322.1 hypothetical protein J3E72DRAFT_365296 [Bipolaris maydis]KAJ6267481.1 hypothetical protein PSV08DRAFT_326128 [Bipolaris maydis]